MRFTGRTTVLAQLRGLAVEGRCVLLRGAPGSGRTSTLREAAAALERRGPVHLVHGSDGSAGVPLAPFSRVIEDRLPRAGTQPDQTLHVYTALPRTLATAGVVVIVDDLMALDRASTVLLAQLARAGVTLIVSTSSEEELPRPILDGLDHEWVVLDLAPLSPDEVLAMAAHLLGDQLDPPAAAVLLARAGGSPGRVVEIVRACTTGTTSSAAGVSLGPLTGTAPLTRRAGAAVGGLTDAARGVVDLLVVAERLPSYCLPPPAVEELTERGLLTCTDEVIAVADPLLADVLMASMSAGQRRLRCGEAAALLTGLDDWQGVRILLQVRAGHLVEPQDLHRAAERALAAHRPDQAVELLTAAAPEGHTPPAQQMQHLLLGAALSAVGELDRARTSLDAAAAGPEEEIRARAGRELGLLHAVRRSDPAVAVTRVEEVIASLISPALRRRLELEQVKWRLMAGLPAPMALDAQGRELVDEVAEVNQAVIAAMVASLDGDPSLAQTEADRGLDALSRTDAVPAFTADLLRLSSYLGQAFDGHLDTAESFATAQRDHAAATADPSLGMWEFATAELALHAGRLREATELVDRAVRHLAWHDFTGLRPAAAALQAAVAARRGRTALAAELVDRIDAAHLRDVKVDLHVARVRAEAHLRVGDTVAAAEELARAGLRAVAESHTHLGVLALDEAVLAAAKKPDDMAPWVVSLAEFAATSPVASALVTRCCALRDRDAAGLVRASVALADLGFAGRAAQAAGAAAEILAAAGRTEPSRVQERRRDLLLTEAAATLWPGRANAPLLTARELEITHFAARRMRSREIAERCGLSVRTVDNHLARIYRKLGITGRDELGDALESLEGFPPG